VITRNAVDEDFLAEVVTRITGAVRPWRIILFGSRARGSASDDSDYDFYVEVDATGDDALRDAYDRIMGALIRRPYPVDLKVHSQGSLEDRRDDPGTLEWDVAREGRALYSDPDASPVIAPSDRVREPSPEAPRSFQVWLKLAEVDLQHRDDLWKLDREYWAQICWLSHQTVEKHLKALLLFHWIRPRRTHDLPTLLGQLERCGKLLSEVRSECDLLNTHAVTARYVPGLLLREPDARRATEAADRVVAAIRPLLQL
jgi:HEPN domain-containing protein/predicted nucleotidyltransferase